jgi:heme A synthase
MEAGSKRTSSKPLLWLFFFVLLGVSAVVLTLQAARGPAALSPLKNSAPIIKILLFLVIALGGWFAGKEVFKALFAKRRQAGSGLRSRSSCSVPSSRWPVRLAGSRLP